ncbi:RagB/SusD family nutrient uptake outer membrane protein [Galbibacter sp. EGI 63066]|uniref:RagB/SusD family nutrient uptake outer membrane protein n=1 Tax=Galbibacter sp. EGI 63066 TaxID=2993559 RepID=UPI002248771A|nr:RagB/SusD family nutrient uptake outer membrane protein [Galbibacter sp. EGI 63066]MCX2679302.1 RagB/SusD family nutrient uptake outer membrane protein [Galbibacter sp. EGI 63066]
MRTFKKHIFNIWILLLLMAFQSCHDKLETVEGQTNVGDTDYTITSDMVQPLIGAYHEFSTRGWEEHLIYAVRGDDVNAAGDQVPLQEADQYNYDPGSWMPNSLWGAHYNDIVHMNNAREQIELYKEFADESDFALADQYRAETDVLRAWLHLNMSRMWSDIFIINSTDIDVELEAGVATKEEVMQYIAGLMDEAMPLLPDLRPNERNDIPGGVTKYTALAIKALALQEIGDYQGVADATGQIINSGKFSLYNDFYQLFKKPGELSDESLLELQFSDFGSESGDAHYHLYAPYGPQGWTPARENAGGGWGFYEPTLKYIKFMLDRDEMVRLQTSVLFTNSGMDEIMSDPDYATLPSWMSNTTPDGDVINDYARANFASGKHYLPSVQLTDGRNNYGGGKNFIVIRYAEILLIYAEALTQGASATAISADEVVNMVRARAGMPALSGVTLQNVVDEKFAELALEWGIRYYDMVRLGMYGELTHDGKTFSEDKVYYPYPTEQVDALPLEN